MRPITSWSRREHPRGLATASRRVARAAADWEYPLWVLLRPAGTIALHHVAVKNPSALKFDPHARGRWPCATIVWDAAEVPDVTARALDVVYSERRSSPPLTLYLGARS